MQPDMQETEVRETTSQDGKTTVQRQQVAHVQHTPGVIVAQRVVWFIAGLMSIIIALRFVLLLLGANQGAGFTDFVYSLSAPLVAPFVGIFGEPSYSVSVFEISSLLAIAVYILIAWGIAKLITLASPHNEI